MEIFHDITPRFQTNTYLLYDPSSKEALWIDPGERSPRIERLLDEEGLKLRTILLTHGHADHIGAAAFYKDKYGAAIAGPQLEAPLLADSKANLTALMGMGAQSIVCDFEVKEGDSIAPFSLRVLETPGHTRGSCSYVVEHMIFCGDLIFQGSVGRWDLPTGNYAQLEQSVDRILQMRNYKIFPGHGPVTDTEKERVGNPFSSYQR